MHDQELMVIVYGLSLVPQFKYVRLKFIQSSPFSIEGVEQFVQRVSKMSHIEKFDLHFRK